MTTNPTSALHQYTALDPVRQAIGDAYVQVRADLLDHPNYRLDVFLERLDRHAAEPGWAAVIAYEETGEPIGSPKETPSAPVTGGGSA